MSSPRTTPSPDPVNGPAQLPTPDLSSAPVPPVVQDTQGQTTGPNVGGPRIERILVEWLRDSDAGQDYLREVQREQIESLKDELAKIGLSTDGVQIDVKDSWM